MPALGAAIWLGTLAWGPAPIELPTASRLLSGDLALPFWIGFVLLGILIPAAVLVLSSFSPMFRLAISSVSFLRQLPPQQSPEQQSFLVAHPAGDSSSHKTFSRIRKTVFKKLL